VNVVLVYGAFQNNYEKKMIIYAWLAKRIGLGGDNSNNHSFYTIHIFMFMNEDGGIIIIGCLMW
jgi:hypothetical protein